MKIILPDNSEIILDDNLPQEEKMRVVDDILSKWGDDFQKRKSTNKVKVCLEILSTYLCKKDYSEEEVE